MTTQNLPGIDALREAIAAAAQGVATRAQHLNSAAEAERQQAQHDASAAAIAARLLEQQHNDNLAAIDEEAAQVAYILAGTPVVTPPAPAAGDVPPVVPAVVDAPVAPAAAATAVAVAVADNGNPSPADPREWGWLAWVLAALGIVLGLVIADWWNADEWVRAQTSTLIGGLFTILWWGGWPAMLGGLFGSFGARREQRR